jgi:hypothetical protein
MTPRCASCMSWKRRVHDLGACYHPSKPRTPFQTYAQHRCEHFTSKLVNVEPPVSQSSWWLVPDDKFSDEAKKANARMNSASITAPEWNTK